MVLPATATVLLVDDDDVLREEVATRLAERFDRVLQAPSAEIALYLCGAHAVDVVATSALLPGAPEVGDLTRSVSSGGAR